MRHAMNELGVRLEIFLSCDFGLSFDHWGLSVIDGGLSWEIVFYKIAWASSLILHVL